MVGRSKKTDTHVKKAIKSCDYPNWDFIKSTTRRKTQQTDQHCQAICCWSTKKPGRIFNKQNKKIVHLDCKTPRHTVSSVMFCTILYTVQFTKECIDLCIEASKQPLYEYMKQYKRTSLSEGKSRVTF